MDARDFNKIEKRAVVMFLFLEGKAPKEIHTFLTETLACFIPGLAKDLSAPLCVWQLQDYKNLLWLDTNLWQKPTPTPPTDISWTSLLCQATETSANSRNVDMRSD